MSLTDQEQVVLKAIRSLLRTPTSPALIADVIKAIGYPKATTKKILARLAEKGIVAVHRHDYPASLTPAERKLMLRLKDGQGNWRYFNAVSMRTRNPKGKGKTALKRAGRALKGFARGALESGAEILGAGAMALNPKGKHLPGLPAKAQRQYEEILREAKQSGRYGKRTKEVAARTVKKRYRKNKTVIKAGRIDHLDVSKVHNPKRRIRVRNKYIDLVIRGQAKKTPQGWRVGKKTFAQGRGTVSVSSGYYLDRSTGLVYAKRERNAMKRRKIGQVWIETRGTAHGRNKYVVKMATLERPYGEEMAESYDKRQAQWEAKMLRKRKRNVEQGFYDASGTFHPIRASADYSPAAAGETGRKPVRGRSKKKVTASRKASQTARRRAGVRARKATTSRLAGRAIRKSSGLLKGKRRNASSKVITKRITTYRTRPIGQYLFSGGMEYFFDGHDGRMAGYKTLAETKAAIDEEARKIDEYRKARGVKIKPPRNALRGRKNPSATESRAMSGRAIDALERLGFKGVVATDMGHPHVMVKKSPDNLDLLRRYKLVRDAAQDNHPHGYYYLTGVRALKKIFALDPLRNPKRNPSAESIRKKFAGSVNGERDLFFPQGTPSGKLAKLGKLISITTEEGTIKPVSGTAWLCADTNEKLHIGSTTNAPLYGGPARSFGKVTKVEYESSKPHLGYKGPIIWFHHMGEKGGTKPTLHADGKGGLKFRGGRYTLTTRGIEH